MRPLCELSVVLGALVTAWIRDKYLAVSSELGKSRQEEQPE